MNQHPSTDAARTPTLLFRMPIELRWRDLDAFNHVNNANFLTFVEEARIRWFESAIHGWATDHHAPLLAAIRMNYRMPIPYPSAVFVELLTERVGNTSLTLGHRIVGENGQIYADGHSVLVWIEIASGRPVQLPEGVRAATA